MWECILAFKIGKIVKIKSIQIAAGASGVGGVAGAGLGAVAGSNVGGGDGRATLPLFGNTFSYSLDEPAVIPF